MAASPKLSLEEAVLVLDLFVPLAAVENLGLSDGATSRWRSQKETPERHTPDWAVAS
jgi:hypothetical protein